MPAKTPAQKISQKKYMDKFARIDVRLEPELRDKLQAHATARGESVSAFAVRAICETIERDKHGKT